MLQANSWIEHPCLLLNKVSLKEKLWYEAFTEDEI
jgi:hypothetical protein